MLIIAVLLAELAKISIWLKKAEKNGYEGADFYNKEIPKVKSNHACLAVIGLDSALKKDENYYPLVFLKEIVYTLRNTLRKE